MVRVLFILSAVLALQTGAFAQCPNGQCPTGRIADLGPVAPVGMKPPSDKHEWRYFPELKAHGWGFKDVGVTAPAPKVVGAKSNDPPSPATNPFGLNVPAPKFNDSTPSDYKPLHGKLFYRVVRDHTYHKLVHEKGMKPADARAKVESLSSESIDTYGKYVGINVAGGLGDGSFLKWLSDHSEQIIALIELIVKLLAFL